MIKSIAKANATILHFNYPLEFVKRGLRRVQLEFLFFIYDLLGSFTVSLGRVATAFSVASICVLL